MANVRLGWADPLTNVLQGEDAAKLRLVFTSLAHWLQFPLIGLHRVNQAIPTSANTAIAWTTELYDESQLHAANATTWRAPATHRTYLAVGAVGVAFDAAAAAITGVTWKLNGAATLFADSGSTTAIASHTTTPFMKMVKSGDTLGVDVFQATPGALDVDAEVWMLFLPMGHGQG